MAQLNTWSDISAIANAVQEDAYLVVRETAIMKNFVTVFSDLSGGNLRKSYKHGSVTAVAINEADELNSSAFTPLCGFFRMARMCEPVALAGIFWPTTRWSWL